MASVTGNGGNFPHFKPPKKPGIFPVFHSIFIESEGVTSFGPGIFPVFRPLPRGPRADAWAVRLPRADAWVILSNSTIAGEFRLASLVGYRMKHKYIVIN